jgi:hypothetical protein
VPKIWTFTGFKDFMKELCKTSLKQVMNASFHTILFHVSRMRVISFDMGLRNLAWCDLTLKPTEGGCVIETIHQWKVKSCIDDDVNVNASSLDFMIKPFVQLCTETLDSLSKDPIDAFLIESQPMGHGRSFGGTSMGGSPRNLKTKVLSHILQSLILLRWPDMIIQFISPTLKMRECPIPFRERTYKDNKKWAITKTEDLVKDLDTKVFGDGIFEGSKKDDLADCFLQGFYVAKLVLAGSMKLEGPESVIKQSAMKKASKEDTKTEKPERKRKRVEAKPTTLKGKKKVEAQSIEDDF